MGIQVDIRGYKICLCFGPTQEITKSDCIRLRLISNKLLPADQLADGLVVSAVAAVQTVVVDWTTGGGVVRCHCKTETMKAQQSFQSNHMASIKVMLYVKNGLVPHAFAPKNAFKLNK